MRTRRFNASRGFTLLEVLLAVTLMGAIAAGAASLFTLTLNVDHGVTLREDLDQEALLIMQRLRRHVKLTTHLMAPNGNVQTRPELIVAARINNDNDFYFGDPLFPRVDEDPGNDMNGDGLNGLAGYDDDGDGFTDEILGGSLIPPLNLYSDDDEAGSRNEETYNGLDDDGDGSIDEDLDADINKDGAPGIKGVDDDGDGNTDEGGADNDDEDGATDEDGFEELLIKFNGQTRTLTQSVPSRNTSFILSRRVTAFKATYLAPTATTFPSVRIDMTLTASDGYSLSVSECIHPGNLVQKNGKRVL